MAYDAHTVAVMSKLDAVIPLLASGLPLDKRYGVKVLRPSYSETEKKGHYITFVFPSLLLRVFPFEIAA